MKKMTMALVVIMAAAGSLAGLAAAGDEARSTAVFYVH